MVSPNIKVSLRKWKATVEKEQRKLTDSSSCKLAGSGSPCHTRTRGKRVPFNRLPSPSNLRIEIPTTTTTTTDDSSTSRPRHLFCSPLSTLSPSTLTTLSGSTRKQRKKPDASRVILETEQLSDLIERNTRCPQCASAVRVTYVTKMIASTIRIDCTDLSCGFVDIEKPTSAKPELPAGSIPAINRNSDAAINILFVLSFLSKGDGGTEASHLLGLLGLPNSTTMDGGSFGAVEKQVGPSILQKIADEVVYKQNLVEEVRESYGQKT